jgi:superfamily II DNA or RNA helicase
MILRPRQETFVNNIVSALDTHGNTLAVAPTGAGKTVCLSAVATRALSCGARKILTIQHRDELVGQNRKTFHAVAGEKVTSGVVDATRKQFHRDNIFAMVQTLSKEKNLDAMPPVDLIMIDEAHHAPTSSYKKILARAAEINDSVKVLGVTATPNRNDKKGMRSVFDNVADQISMAELISSGFLVPPRIFVVDIGVGDDLRSVKRNVSDFDMSEVAKIMDHKILNDRIIEAWKEKAGDRSTVVFCSTVEHAAHVAQAFAESGVATGMVDGKLSGQARKDILASFERGEIQVIVNVAVLTEGWDCQHVGCVVLLRPSSFKSTMVQMIGRGLRKMDPEKYPGWPPKKNCIVLDFGTSILTHGGLDSSACLEEDGEPRPPKECPECKCDVPFYAKECSICGFVFEADEPAGDSGPPPEKEALDSFVMTEVDVLNASPYRWEELFDARVLMATAFQAWTCVVFYNGNWHTIAGAEGDTKGVRVRMRGEKMMCLADADDFLRVHGDVSGAAKSKTWLHLGASEKQLKILSAKPYDLTGISRYRAACLLTWMFNERAIQAGVTS